MDDYKIRQRVVGMFILIGILVIGTFFTTKQIVRKQTINEIYNFIDVQFSQCIEQCTGLMPSWVNIRNGIAECYCLAVLDDRNQSNNQLSDGNN